MTTLIRQSIGAAVSSILVLVLAACDSGANEADGPASSGRTLTVLGLGADVNRYTAEGMQKQFEDETGATIKWLPGAAPDNLAKLLAAKQSGRPPADVVILDSRSQPVAAAAGAIDKLDYPSLLAKYDQFEKSAWQVPGYGPAYEPMRVSICYNKDVYNELGQPYPTGIDDWFNPALKGKVAISDTPEFTWGAIMPGIAAHYGTSLDNPAPLMKKFAEMDAHTLTTSSSDSQQLLQSGAVAYATLTDGRCLSLKMQGVPVDLAPGNIHVAGKEWMYIGLADTIDVVSGTAEDKQKLAGKFIDLYTGVGQLPYLKLAGYAVTRRDTLSELKAMPTVGDVLKGFNPADLYYADYQAFQPHIQEWIDAWNEIVK
jgi:spermidine/putrescine-binding protein